jgi:sigma-E factor negative regulatory protein RseC
MITEPATVVRVDGDIVWVRCEAQQGCRRCAEGRGCGGGLLGKLLGDRLRTVRAARGEFRLTAGDTVVIGLAETALVRASVAMYLIPLLTMLAAAVIAWRVGDQREAWAISGGLAGFLAGLAYARRFGSRHDTDSRYQPVVIARSRRGERVECQARPA